MNKRLSRERYAHPNRSRGFLHGSTFACLVVVLTVVSGCSVLEAPQKVVSSVVPGMGTGSHPDPTALQIQIERFADDFSSRTADALDNYAQHVGTEQARIQALQLKVRGISSMLAIASGPNPNVNLLDLVSVAVLTRMTVENYWMKTPEAPAFQVWLESSRTMETNAWILASTFLKHSQLHELRQAIDHWYANNPELRAGFLARPQEFAAMVRTHKGTELSVDSVFNLVGLDPTIGLDPAVREVTLTRLFAERALYTVQRMPFLIRFQTELAAYQLAEIPQFQQVITNSTRLSDSAERISQTAAQLPGLVSSERKAILEAMQEQEGKLKELAAEIDRTLISGAKMSDSLNTTLVTFDGLMKLFGVGQPDTNSVPDTNSAPFNILDYGKVADQIGGMAKELNVLLATANQNVTQLTRLSDEATTRADRIVDRAFHRGVLLIVILLVGTVLAALTYRALSRKSSGG